MNENNENENVCIPKNFAQNVIDSIGDPIIVIDPSNYKLLLANKAMSEQIKEVDLLTGSVTCHQATHRRDTPCDFPDDPCPLKKVIATKSTVRVVHIHYDDENNESIIDVVATPILDESGNVMQVIESFHDITHIMQEKIALQKSEKMFKTLFNNAGDAIMMHDMEGHFIEVNQIACDQLGYTRDELLKMSPIDLNSPEYSKMVPDRIRKIRDDGHGIFETALLRKDGSSIPVELSSRMIEYGEDPMILCIARDITERKRTEKIL
ncbi:MAG TPA: PAS domain S-box protein [Methanosarcinaceae archaeon]|nr:PAS domain S-box protein [Methanosarcinaceae archaeon]